VGWASRGLGGALTGRWHRWCCARPRLQRLKRSSLALAGHGLAKLKKRLRPDSVYVAVLVFSSHDMRILLTPNGLLPTLTVAHGRRQVRLPSPGRGPARAQP